MRIIDGTLYNVNFDDLNLLRKNPEKFWKGVKCIGKEAFSHVTINEIVIPEGVERIEERAFSGNYTLGKITLPESLNFIGREAFQYCKSLESIEVPRNVTEIGISAFHGCDELKSAKIQGEIIEIKHETFKDCWQLKNFDIPTSVISIGQSAFYGCESLEKINFHENIKEISFDCFYGCKNLKEVVLPENIETVRNKAFSTCSSLERVVINGKKEFGEKVFFNCKQIKEIELDVTKPSLNYEDLFCFSGFAISSSLFKYIYQLKDKYRTVFSNDVNDELEKIAVRKDGFLGLDTINRALDYNYTHNFVDLNKLKSQGKINFIPPDYVLLNFPNEIIDRFYVNNNNHKWGRLVKEFGIDKLPENEKENSITDLFKLYYSLGGFSQNQGDRELAYEYIRDYIIGKDAKGKPFSPEKIGYFIHDKFSGIKLNGEYSHEFAEFFMKYYKENPDFMDFCLTEDEDGFAEETSYLIPAFNSFKNILRNFPNRRVNGNEQRALLTPRFVAEHCMIKSYEDVNYGNENLASLISRYCYDQKNFDRMQVIFDQAKAIKNPVFLSISGEKKGLKYRVLAKDDPLGFILGDITNCCQKLGDAGESCVRDGYINKESGFLVFEEIKDDKKDNKIVGQAYIWYDPKTKTVCYDNIEVPTKVISELSKGSRKNENLSFNSFLDIVELSCDDIMESLNERGYEVERVTAGEAYNDLEKILKEKFGKVESNPIAKHRNYVGYTDAKEGQYLLKTSKAFARANMSAVKNIKIANDENDDIKQDDVCNHENVENE